MPKPNTKSVTRARARRAKTSISPDGGGSGPQVKISAKPSPKSATQTRQRAKTSITSGRFHLKIPVKSIANAKKAFRNFSLSRFSGTTMPPNYVAAGQSPAQAQEQIISQNLAKRSASQPSGGGMTVAFPESVLKQLLPSFDQKTGTVDLGEVLNLIQQNMRGTEFYASGNPTLNRLAIQSQVQQIVASLKGGASK